VEFVNETRMEIEKFFKIQENFKKGLEAGSDNLKWEALAKDIDNKKPFTKFLFACFKRECFKRKINPRNLPPKNSEGPKKENTPAEKEAPLKKE
jgi:hypothetical protein